MKSLISYLIQLYVFTFSSFRSMAQLQNLAIYKCYLLTVCHVVVFSVYFFFVSPRRVVFTCLPIAACKFRRTIIKQPSRFPLYDDDEKRIRHSTKVGMT